VRDADKAATVEVARSLAALGFELVATRGTAETLAAAGLEVSPVNKVTEGQPHIVDSIKNGEIALIINTVDEKKSSIEDSWSIRNAALQGRVTYYTTVAGARAAATGIGHLQTLEVYPLQGLHSRAH
jgi:carbamoyl-phosphate synthase large subunit